jgi:nucleoid-associated protein YgaU
MLSTMSLRRAGGLFAAVLFALSLAVTAGAQGYDVSSGTYLSPEQYKKLSKEEALEYCESLAQEIDIQNDNAAAANAQMSDLDAEIASLKRQLAEVTGVTGPLAKEVAELEAKLKQLQELPRSYTVVKGDYLIKISEMRRIYNDGTLWKRIYRGNRDKIDDPNLIYPDQIFLIPRGKPTMHTVVEGESLRRIASYWEIYKDGNQWQRIYEANKDKISNPDIIHPGMELRIPR